MSAVSVACLLAISLCQTRALSVQQCGECETGVAAVQLAAGKSWLVCRTVSRAMANRCQVEEWLMQWLVSDVS